MFEIIIMCAFAAAAAGAHGVLDFEVFTDLDGGQHIIVDGVCAIHVNA